MHILQEKLDFDFFEKLGKRLGAEITLDGKASFMVKCSDGKNIDFKTDGRSTIYAMFPINVSTGEQSYAKYAERRSGVMEAGFTRLWLDFICQKVEAYNQGEYEEIRTSNLALNQGEL